MTAAPRGTAPAPGNAAGATHAAAHAVASDRLYWAVFSAPPLSRWARWGVPTRRDIDALRFAAEEWIPAPLDEVELRFAPANDQEQTFVACGLERDRLRAMIAELENGGSAVDSLHPAALAPAVARRLGETEPRSREIAAALERLDLRTGALESPARRRRRVAFAARVLAALTISSALATLALFGAARRASEAATLANTAAAQIATQALASIGVDPGANEPLVRLAAELRTLERTRAPGTPRSSNAPGAAASAANPLKEDRSALFIALLSRWPEDIPLRVDSLQIDQSSVMLRGQARTGAQAEAALLALEGLGADPDSARWSLQSKSLGRSGEAATFTAVFAPEPPAAGRNGGSP